MDKIGGFLKSVGQSILYSIIHIIISAVFCWFLTFAVKFSLGYTWDWIKVTVLFYAVFFIIRRFLIILNLKKD